MSDKKRPNGTYLTQLESVKDITPTQLNILKAFGSLLTYSGKEFKNYREWRYVSWRKLSKITKYSRSTIYRNILSLEKNGYLLKRKRKSKIGGDASSDYCFTEKALNYQEDKNSAPEKPNDSEECHGETPPSVTVKRQGVMPLQVMPPCEASCARENFREERYIINIGIGLITAPINNNAKKDFIKDLIVALPVDNESLLSALKEMQFKQETLPHDICKAKELLKGKIAKVQLRETCRSYKTKKQRFVRQV